MFKNRFKASSRKDSVMQLDALLRRWEREKGNFPHAARKQAELALQKLNAEPQAAVKAKTNPSAIFNSFTEYLQKIAFYSGVAALGAYVVKNKLGQLWGYDLSTVVGLLITILSFFAASFTTFFLLVKDCRAFLIRNLSYGFTFLGRHSSRFQCSFSMSQHSLLSSNYWEPLQQISLQKIRLCGSPLEHWSL